MIRVVRTVGELNAALLPHWKARDKIGFVPTMGALHEGHVSLLEKSVAENAVTVLSIFVNPTQFGAGEDFSKYPRTFEEDLARAEAAGVQYVFAPTPEVIYPEGWRTFVEVEKLPDVLCGRFRPGHFRGVTTVVYRLFSLVKPGVAYFGQKDLQQCLVIGRMVEDLMLPLRIEIVPTMREEDGLAMSSRNRYLSQTERAQALVISRALVAVRDAVGAGERSVEKLLAVAGAVFAEEPAFQLQYAEIRGLPDLEEITRVEGTAAFAVAGFLGKTRLIDNVVLRGN